MSTTDCDIAERVAKMFNTKPSAFQSKRPGSKPAWVIRKQGPRAVGWMLTLYSLMGNRRQSQIRAALSMYTPPRKFKTFEAM